MKGTIPSIVMPLDFPYIIYGRRCQTKGGKVKMDRAKHARIRRRAMDNITWNRYGEGQDYYDLPDEEQLDIYSEARRYADGKYKTWS